MAAPCAFTAMGQTKARNSSLRCLSYPARCSFFISARGMLELNADDIECLWAIVNDGALLDRLVRERGKVLESAGLIEIVDDAPILTPDGRDVLVNLATKMVRALHASAT